jgi:NAD(P)-dependent dehydrogenase (short-subunit alcohol dehydrogenase family)
VQIEGGVAIVTGANRGIGRALTEALLERGAGKVYGAARDVVKIADPRVVPVQLDVTDPDRFAVLAEELDDVELTPIGFKEETFI